VLIEDDNVKFRQVVEEAMLPDPLGGRHAVRDNHTGSFDGLVTLLTECLVDLCDPVEVSTKICFVRKSEPWIGR
jgi:hypothetical protein